ncbi:MAG: hypothetical protein Q7S96_01000 [bacterium]|nr:hypothetical protein [bacterium]
MTNGSPRDPITRVLEQIERGELHMRSKARILLGTILLALVSAFVFILAIYLISFGIFSLRTSGVLLLPGFGTHGLVLFFRAFPWGLVIVSAVLILILARMARLLPFLYRRPIVVAVIAALALSGSFGLALDQTPLHPILSARTARGSAPLVRELYEHGGSTDVRGAYRGTVTFASADTLEIMTTAGAITVRTVPETRWPFGMSIHIGSQVFVVGEIENGIVRAYGVRPILARSIFSDTMILTP